ncbi:hypothetical protein [Ferrovibrio sp.]|uniref:hypothetical protein n=1 Tax=Ferrovibrio sp. TaxID=1917215 RepID=UPI0035125014
MFSAAKLQVMYKVMNAPLRLWPFPHICVPDIFPQDFYAEIQRHRLADDCFTRLVDTGRVGKDYSGARACLFPQTLDATPAPEDSKAFWRSLFKTFRDSEFSAMWAHVFRAAMTEKLADHKMGFGDLRLYNEMFLMRDTTTYSLGPHTDSPRKMVSVLFYLPSDDRRAALGTSAYIPKDRGFTCLGGPHHPFENFDLVATMPYLPNTLVAFPQTKRSFHGVEPVTQPDALRDLLLFDLKTGFPGE